MPSVPPDTSEPTNHLSMEYVKYAQAKFIATLRHPKDFFDYNRISRPNGITGVTSRVNYNGMCKQTIYTEHRRTL